MDLVVLTLFPGMFRGPFDESIIRRAREKGKVRIQIVDLRDFTLDRHGKVDDRPYGGGPGMLLSPQPVFSAVRSLKGRSRAHVVYLTPQGRPFTTKVAKRLARLKKLILVCGHYEGMDERARRALMDEELSVGDVVTTGGEIPAMVVVDAVVRLLPGVLGDRHSVCHESFENSLLEGPQYTRPAVYDGMRVPAVLLSGDHRRINDWRRRQALKRTRERRPDLLPRTTSGDRKIRISNTKMRNKSEIRNKKVKTNSL
ncbi:MAG: tRNA (guanosine(37)-N1)-methyltransferase TrmD [Candidatus Omnitrophica bacterium]|nr:tRNA (guanosine(37)-N1)-methyltransferase TrmD [Candidatus Omnitrophota bacterium]